MKRLALAGVVALTLTLACQQKAAAGGFGIQFNIGGNCSSSSCCSGHCSCPGCYYCGYGYAWAPAPCSYNTPIVWPCNSGGYSADAYYGMGNQAVAPAYAAQPASYYPSYAGGYYGGNYYASNQGPGYWYGR
jgi:hypothetical protein